MKKFAAGRYRLGFIITVASLAGCAGHETRRDADGLTPLHRAAGRGDTKLVATLLEQGADLWALDSKMSVSALHKAVYSGNVETVELLLRRGAPINLASPSNGDTPLHDALYFKSGSDVRVIQTILSYGPNVNIRNRAGLTPLESARILKDEQSLALLTRYYAFRYTEAGKKLMAATKANDLPKVRRLAASGPLNLEEADEQGFTPLVWAAREGFAEIVAFLLDKGADPNHNDEWMKANAGHKAAFWGRASVMRLLVQHKLDINARGGYNGYTPLHDAVARGHIDVVKVLLESGARTDIEGHDGKRALDLARSANNPVLIQLLER